eukprot:TRINITY_DN428_c0_g3_i1.p1 TRINITY_DN428_c0_g3~~TRINITY_DN428_c0_g3_i1.p1  ORF type:complete len:588 (+),score=114.86 TRINITY_DN428_c0_g3_i1:29-1765(+)
MAPGNGEKDKRKPKGPNKACQKIEAAVEPPPAEEQGDDPVLVELEKRELHLTNLPENATVEHVLDLLPGVTPMEIFLTGNVRLHFPSWDATLSAFGQLHGAQLNAFWDTKEAVANVLDEDEAAELAGNFPSAEILPISDAILRVTDRENARDLLFLFERRLRSYNNALGHLDPQCKIRWVMPQWKRWKLLGALALNRPDEYLEEEYYDAIVQERLEEEAAAEAAAAATKEEERETETETKDDEDNEEEEDEEEEEECELPPVPEDEEAQERKRAKLAAELERVYDFRIRNLPPKWSLERLQSTIEPFKIAKITPITKARVVFKSEEELSAKVLSPEGRTADLLPYIHLSSDAVNSIARRTLRLTNLPDRTSNETLRGIIGKGCGIYPPAVVVQLANEEEVEEMKKKLKKPLWVRNLWRKHPFGRWGEYPVPHVEEFGPFSKRYFPKKQKNPKPQAPPRIAPPPVPKTPKEIAEIKRRRKQELDRVAAEARAQVQEHLWRSGGGAVKVSGQMESLILADQEPFFDIPVKIKGKMDLFEDRYKRSKKGTAHNTRNKTPRSTKNSGKGRKDSNRPAKRARR